MKKITLIFVLLSGFLFAQKNEKIINGVILDERNEPVVGASVFASSNIVGNKTNAKGTIQGTMIGTTTDFDGKFTFKAPEKTKSITISFLGYETKIVNVSNKYKNLTINIVEKKEVLDEVVITGYQKIEKRKSTSAYKNVKTSELKQVATPNIDRMLEGQVSGVVVTPTNGAPGAVAQIQIRGITSLNGSSDPLWVIDGVPLEGNLVPKNFDKDNLDNLTSYPIAGINPEDIEDITVLKDASATSIYGARAANGVIVITTKRGKEGSMQFSFSANTSVGLKPNLNKLNLMNANEKVDFELLLASRKDLTYKAERGEVARILNSYNEYNNFQQNGFSALPYQVQNKINSLRKINTDWGDYLYQNTINTNYNFSLSGGSKKSNYYLSLGYFDQEGTTKGTGFKRYNVTLKNSFNITDKFTVTASVFANRNINNSYVIGADAYTNPASYIRRVNPYQQVVDKNGNYVYDKDLTERSDLNLNYNILEEQNNTSNKLVANSIKPMLNLEYKFNKNLNISSQLGLQFDFDDTEKITDEDSYYTRKYRFSSKYTNNEGKEDYFMPKGGIVQNWNSKLFQYNWKTLLNYSKKFASVHEVDIMLGSEFRRNKKTTVFSRGFGFNSNTLQTVQITNEMALNRPSFRTYQKIYNENAFASFFGTASYTYNRKYTIFGSLRYDGSNLFGVNPKYRYLPIWSVAGTWNVSREKFMENVEFINLFNIRGSYGVQGSIDKSTSPFVVGVYDKANILPNVTEEIIRAESAPNANLRWEKTTSSNIGFDLGLFNNRINITADYYTRLSTDLIGLKSTSLENGFGFVNANWASINNKGYEIGITTKNIKTDNFSWTTNLNFSHNENKINKIEINEEQLKPSKQGYGVYSIFGIKTAGIDENGLPIFIKNGKTVSAVDFYKLGKGLSREEHRNLYSYIGDGTPKFTGGFTNTFKYKQFSLRIASNFSLFKTVKETPYYNPTYIEPGYNYNREVLNEGTGNLPAFIGLNSPGFDTKLVYNWYHSQDDGKTYRDLDIWIKEISYFRINNIRLSYDFKSNTIDKIGLNSLNISLEGRNLFVFGTDYTGYFDPEGFGSIYRQPIQKSVSLGLNMSF
ncbi:MAG: SusC/RagA family TonB-linked outer membrane protein [Tenacibaculum sp.]|nr:SusC/RagA family TonB-linked outer membrane protein [Tenacibaculum sp.]